MEPIDRRIVETPLPAGLDLLDVASLSSETSVWVMLGSDGRLARLDCGSGDWHELGRVEIREEPGHKPWYGRPLTPRLHVSPRGDFVAVVNDYASLGAIYDGRTMTRTLELDGGVYCRETVAFAFAFLEHAGRTVAIHRTAWNRLDVSDAATGELLTARSPTSFTRDEPRPPHYLDYFHGRLFLSPDGGRILDDGWVWHPLGIPCVWDLREWLDSNVWESVRDSYWDQAMCWLDSTRIAIGGLGDDVDEIVAGARIFSAVESASSERVRWPSARELTSFAGPGGDFFSDGVRLFSSDEDGLSVWDVETGARTARVDGFRPAHQHRADRELVEVAGDVLRRWRY